MTDVREPQTDREFLIHIYDTTKILSRDVGEMKVELKKKPDMNVCIEKHKKQDDININHEGRIGSLEKWRWWIMGGVALAVFIISILVRAKS